MLPLIEQTVLDQQSLLLGKAVKVVINPSCQSQVLAQPGMLKVLLDNLLSNAFQHTQQGEVSIYYEDGVLRIKDTGCGIEPTIAGQITEAAVKGNHSSGFGFGLSIVKRLCEHQGWQLTVDTGNTGTTVSVALL